MTLLAIVIPSPSLSVMLSEAKHLSFPLRVCEKIGSWFDKLTTNGTTSMEAVGAVREPRLQPFVLSPSKGDRRFFHTLSEQAPRRI